jgi:hypothetical protein
LFKIHKEKYEKVVAINECSVVVRLAEYKNYRKSSSYILRAVGVKIRKPKHSPVKIHLLGDISRKGLTHLVMFKCRMYDYDFQHFLTLGILPFIQPKMPFGHRCFMDNDPKTYKWIDPGIFNRECY